MALGLEPVRPVFKSQLCHILALWPSELHLTGPQSLHLWNGDIHEAEHIRGYSSLIFLCGGRRRHGLTFQGLSWWENCHCEPLPPLARGRGHWVGVPCPRWHQCHCDSHGTTRATEAQKGNEVHVSSGQAVGGGQETWWANNCWIWQNIKESSLGQDSKSPGLRA